MKELDVSMINPIMTFTYLQYPFNSLAMCILNAGAKDSIFTLTI